MVAPIPAYEQQRLAALRALQILDTPPEERFDRITRATRRLLGVKAAQITLVDEKRQWFKSSCGLPLGESPRDVSFCAHAILEERVFEVADSLSDPRFAENPLVRGEPFIRFYAGRPLKGPGGLPIGTLCLIGNAPRLLTTEERQTLEDLAVWAEDQLNGFQLHQAVSLLRRSEQRLHTILTHLPDGIVTVTSEERIDSVNPAALDLLGRPHWEVVGERADRFFPTLEPGHHEITLLRPSSSVPVDLGVTPVAGLLVVTLRDITVRKRLQAMQQDMVHMLVHDLRSPLTGILGFADLLLEDQLPEGAVEDVQQIRHSAQRMRHMVTEMLDISRLEAGQLPISPRPCQPLQLIRQVLDGLNPAVRDRVQVQGGQNVTLSADPELLARVLENLIGNALKYGGKEGPIEIEIGETGRLSVRDFGPGLSETDQRHIFQKFHQVGDPQPHSSGVGLAFCKLVAEAHGGEIGVRSFPGQGATFWIELPVSDDESLRRSPADRRVPP